MTGSDDLVVRRARIDEQDQLVDLAGRALGWNPDEPNGDLFAWKHGQNPFGPSPMWVAELGDRMVGFRVFLRWRFRSPDGRTLDAVRAVDTATDPAHLGRGIFTRLTTHAIDEVRAEGVDFVFNTPNDQSRPGYLKMGWHIGGRLPISVRPRLARLPRIAGARQAADKWSLPMAGGIDADAAFGDDEAVDHLLRLADPTDRLVTDRSATFLRWRYGFEPLHYRVVTASDSIDDGFAVVRRRRRGASTEVTVCDVVLPRPSSADRRRLTRRVRDAADGDYLIRAGGPLVSADGFVRLPSQGPIVTFRPVASEPPTLTETAFRLGDIELF